MNFDSIIRLLPLMPQIQEMLATIERLEADPDVKAAIATAEAVAKVLSASTAQGTTK